MEVVERSLLVPASKSMVYRGGVARLVLKLRNVGGGEVVPPPDVEIAGYGGGGRGHPSSLR